MAVSSTSVPAFVISTLAPGLLRVNQRRLQGRTGVKKTPIYGRPYLPMTIRYQQLRLANAGPAQYQRKASQDKSQRRIRMAATHFYAHGRVNQLLPYAFSSMANSIIDMRFLGANPITVIRSTFEVQLNVSYASWKNRRPDAKDYKRRQGMSLIERQHQHTSK